MTRTAFLAALEQLLAPLPEAERKDALSYYEDYLDTAGPENEARAIAELGSPEEVAHKILDEQTPADNSAAPVSPARKPRSRWRMVLGGSSVDKSYDLIVLYRYYKVLRECSHTVHNVLMACCLRRRETDCLDFCQTVCLLWICKSDL